MVYPSVNTRMSTLPKSPCSTLGGSPSTKASDLTSREVGLRLSAIPIASTCISVFKRKSTSWRIRKTPLPERSRGDGRRSPGTLMLMGKKMDVLRLGLFGMNTVPYRDLTWSFEDEYASALFQGEAREICQDPILHGGLLQTPSRSSHECLKCSCHLGIAVMRG